MPLPQPLQLDWHDATCRRLDFAPLDDHWATCLSCGSSGLMPCSLPPLPAESSFRLLWLLPGRPEDSVRCNIHVDDLKNDPFFDAISYTWADENGDDRKLAEIFIDGKPFKVTVNCKAALRRVRQRKFGSYIWIDAICIDQENDMERGHQVRLMPQIYHQAQKVLAYVGEHDDLSLDMLKYLHRLDVLKHMGLPGTEQRSQDDLSLSSERGRVIWTALKERKYFTRLWIIQEIALARQAIVLCGDSSFYWKNLTVDFADVPERGVDRQYSVLGLDRSISARPNMELYLLDSGRAACARDPRDKVYGLLGLLPGQRIGTVVADYTISAQHLYTEVAVQLAQLHGWPAVLARAGTEYQSLSSLPSWVPDWTYAPTELTAYYPPPPHIAQSSQNSLPFKGTLRLCLIPYDISGDEWLVPDLQNGSIETYTSIPQNPFWFRLLQPGPLHHPTHQRLYLTLESHQSPDSSLKVLHKATFSNKIGHKPIKQGIFAPISSVMFKSYLLSSERDFLHLKGYKRSWSILDIIASLRKEYSEHLKNEPAEAWMYHAENLWAEKYPPETVTKMGFSLKTFTMNDLLWRWFVRQHAVRSQLVDIV